MTLKILNEDLVRLRGERYNKWSRETKMGVVKLLFWGDEVDLVKASDASDTSVKEVEVRYHDYYTDTTKIGFIRKRKKNKKHVPLKI